LRDRLCRCRTYLIPHRRILGYLADGLERWNTGRGVLQQPTQNSANLAFVAGGAPGNFAFSTVSLTWTGLDAGAGVAVACWAW